MVSELDRKIAQRIANSENILIASHVRPDADAVGSMLGLGIALLNAGKQVQMVLQDGAKGFEYLPKADLIVNTPSINADMIVVVDCSDPERVGDVLDAYPSPDLVVDHHKTNLQFGEFNVVEPEQVATSAILYDRIPLWGLAFDEEVAICLLSAIVGDTIGFRTAQVDSEVLRKSAALMDLGANLFEIYSKGLTLKSFQAIRYWGSGLQRVQCEDKLVWTSLTLADREEVGYPGNDDADLVNILSSVKEASIAVIFVEQSKNKVKISWRAKPGIDVSGIAFEFGGGGHAAAAGADIEGTLSDVQEKVIQKTKQLLTNINKR
ncbi:MAG: DHH family phosphoesterase [Brevefilum sp.]|jgi:phosphoesterase RecJ-like protein